MTFSQPVDIASVLDSEMNFFIAPKQRTSEIPMPGYAPTASGIIGKGSFLPSDPYKFFVTEGDQTKNNYKMWALMITDEFRYPAETNDMRGGYEYFMAWASSNGAEHAEWYLESADAGRINREHDQIWEEAANASQPFSHPEDAGGPRAARVSRTAGPCGASAGPGTAGFETPRDPAASLRRGLRAAGVRRPCRFRA